MIVRSDPLKGRLGKSDAGSVLEANAWVKPGR